MNKTRWKMSLMGGCIALLLGACTRAEPKASPDAGMVDAGANATRESAGTATTMASDAGGACTTSKMEQVASAHWPEDVPTSWFAVWQDDKGAFVPVDCINLPLRRMVYRQVPGGKQVMFQDMLQEGENRSFYFIRNAQQGVDVVELGLAQASEKKPSTRLVYQRQGEGNARWLRDGKPIELHPLGELNRWRVRRFCQGTPFLEGTTEAAYIREQYEKHPERTPEIQGWPQKPAVEVASWSTEALEGLSRVWLELMPGDEQVLLSGCDRAFLSPLLEFRQEGDAMVLERGGIPYLVRKLSRESGLLRLSLADAKWGRSIEQEVEIRFEPGASEAKWIWMDVSEASDDTRRGLPLESALKLPRRTICE